MFEACEREVRSFHEFLEGWLSGTVPETDAAFARTDALAAPFEIVGPDGERRDRAALLADLRAAHGSRPALTVEIQDVRRRIADAEGDLALVTYRERQADAGESTVRLTSALFGNDPDAPNGVAWLHAHETWLEAGGE